MALYDDFESGNLNKWDYWENYAPNYVQVNEGNVNIPTRHLEMYCQYPWTSYRNLLISNGNVGSGRYIKCGILRHQFIQSAAVGMVIKCDASGNTFYLGTTELTVTRIWKVSGWKGTPSLLQLISTGNGWDQNTNHLNAEFYQEANGNLVLKRNGTIMAQVVDTSLTGNKIGFSIINAGILWADNVEFSTADIATGSRRRRLNFMRGLS